MRVVMAADTILGRKPYPGLLAAVGDAAFGQVVGREFDGNAVAGEDADVVLAHAPGDVGEDHMPVVQLHAEGGVRQGLDDFAFHLDVFFFWHARSQSYGEPESAASRS